MKNFILSALAVVALLATASLGAARTLPPFYGPTGSGDGSLNSLDHYDADLWGIDISLDPGEYITGAKLEIKDIYNWNWDTSNLYISLLDNGPDPLIDPVIQFRDGQNTPDFFDTYDPNSVDIVNYDHTNIGGPINRQGNNNPIDANADLSYTFNSSQVSSLSLFAADGRFGLGFDADCHFWNNGITLTITTATNEVPEPATMILFGAGIAGLAGLRRNRKK